MNPNVIIEDPANFQVLILADDLDLSDVSRVLARAIAVLEREVETGFRHQGWSFEPDETRVLLIS